MPSIYDILANSDDCPADIKQRYFAVTKDANAIIYNVSRLKCMKAKAERLMLEGKPEQKARAAQAIKAHIQAIPELKAQIEKGQDGKLATIRRVVEAMENALGKDAYGK